MSQCKQGCHSKTIQICIEGDDGHEPNHYPSIMRINLTVNQINFDKGTIFTICPLFEFCDL